jgi:hypothetical protein
MKLSISSFFIVLGLIACDSPKEKSRVEKINEKDISPSSVKHDTLSKEQLVKITKIQKTFADVYPANLEETVTNFKRDQNPDREIEVWQQMASAYEMFLKNNTSLDSAEKNEAFMLLLLRSMMPDKEAIQEANVIVLNKGQFTELLKYYKSAPASIGIIND